MTRSVRRLIGMLGLAGFLAAGIGGAQAATPLKLAYSVWIGYGPLFVAQENGYFAEEGLDVELVLIEDAKIRFSALASGRIDLLVTTVDTMLQYLREDRSYRYLFALDESIGADGIVANTDIQSPADLAGKRVAYGQGSVMEFLLSVVLEPAGLTTADVTTINMTAGDAGSAFITRQVDAAVTWEPYLSRGAATDHGHKLLDSSAYPGVIADIMVAPAETTETHAAEIAALYRAWVKAVDFAKANPEEANAIMGAGLGGWLKDPAVIADVLTGVRFVDGERNIRFMGADGDPGIIVGVAEKAIDLWSRQGNLRVDVEAGDLVSLAAFAE